MINKLSLIFNSKFLKEDKRFFKKRPPNFNFLLDFIFFLLNSFSAMTHFELFISISYFNTKKNVQEKI